MRLFVCDDTDAHRALLRAVLADTPGVEIVGEAADGASCLVGIAATHPDALVLDLHMPVLDGWQVLERLHGAGDDVPRVLVMSSDVAAADQVRAEGVAFLAKGAPIDELRSAVLGLEQRA